MRVLHLPTPVAGNPLGICQGERLLGLESDILVTFKDKYYSGFPVLFGFPPTNMFGAIKHLPKIFSEMYRISREYDVLNFNSARTLLDYPSKAPTNMLDIGYFNKRQDIFVTCNGCDVRLRTRAANLPHSPCRFTACNNRVCQGTQFESVKLRRMKIWEKYAKGIFAATPDLLRDLPKRAILVPNTLTNWDSLSPLGVLNHTGPLKVLHAPSNRLIKGTSSILEACTRLSKKYPQQLELILVEEMTHKQALELYRVADVIVDQLRIGWYGVLAMEAMKLGKPVVSYYRDEECDLYLPREMSEELHLSVINSNPLEIEMTLERLLKDPDLLVEYRKNALKFVDNWHSPKYVAGLTKEAYDMDTRTGAI